MDYALKEPFKMPATKFVTVLALSKLLYWIAAAGLLLALSIIPAILLDIRWVLLPMILLLLIAPAALAMLYIWYGTLPGYYQNIALHTAECTDSHIVIRTLWGKTDDHASECRVRTHRIPMADLQPPQILAGGQLWLYKNRRGFVWIPINY